MNVTINLFYIGHTHVDSQADVLGDQFVELLKTFTEICTAIENKLSCLHAAVDDFMENLRKDLLSGKGDTLKSSSKVSCADNPSPSSIMPSSITPCTSVTSTPELLGKKRDLDATDIPSSKRTKHWSQNLSEQLDVSCNSGSGDYEASFQHPSSSCCTIDLPFPYCGRCASKGGKVMATSFGSCKSCTKVVSTTSPFCLRCDNFLVNKGEPLHKTDQCPHRYWVKRLTSCILCGSTHRKCTDQRLAVLQMTEYVFVSITGNTKLRRDARKHFGYHDPGVVLKNQKSPGTVKDFLAWLAEMNQDAEETNFTALVKFILKFMHFN